MHGSACNTVVSGTFLNDRRIHIPEISDYFIVVTILYTCREHDRDTMCKGQPIIISLLVIYSNLYIFSVGRVDQSV